MRLVLSGAILGLIAGAACSISVLSLFGLGHILGVM